MGAGEFPPAVRALLRDRSGGVCERCEQRPVADLHHRCPRKQGGSRLPWVGLASNGLALCDPCHDWVESNRTLAYELGLLIKQGIAEQAGGCASIPFHDTTGRIWLIFDDGAKVST